MNIEIIYRNKSGHKVGRYTEDNLTKEQAIAQAKVVLAEASIDDRGFDGITNAEQFHPHSGTKIYEVNIREIGKRNFFHKQEVSYY